MTIVPLPYEIAHCSSWDADHDPEQLVASSPGNRSLGSAENGGDNLDYNDADDLRSTGKVKGWQTPK